MLAPLLWLAAAASAGAASSLPAQGWPLFFESVPAPAGEPPCFLARGPNCQFLIGPAEVKVVLCEARPAAPPAARNEWRSGGVSNDCRIVRMTIAGANPLAELRGAGRAEGAVNYLVGNDPGRWRRHVPAYQGVEAAGIYPGVDLTYYCTQRQLEYDFTVAPGVDPSVIAIAFEGVDRLTVDGDGNLVWEVGGNQIRQPQPQLYQVRNGSREPVTGSYRLRSQRLVGFDVGDYDPRLPLVIDPIVAFSTYFGGNGAESSLAVKVDAEASIYIAGGTLSTSVPFSIPTNAFQSTFNGGVHWGDAFVAKFDNTGARLVYFTYLGGSGDDAAYDLAVDPAGHAYLTGFTQSPDFPTRNALFGQIAAGPVPDTDLYESDAFVAELSPDGASLVYSTFLGGTGADVGGGIAVDRVGNACVTGSTYSSNFPVANAWQPYFGGVADAFVTRVAAGGTSLLYSTYLGGEFEDQGQGIAVTTNGSAFVTGYTESVLFPTTTNVMQRSLNLSSNVAYSDAFVTRLGAAGQPLFSTYLGGSLNDYGYRIALDAHDLPFIAGASASFDFPTTTNIAGLQPAYTNAAVFGIDAFLTGIDSLGRHPLFSVLFGGDGSDSGYDLALDGQGRAFVTGTTDSTNFPVINPGSFLQGKRGLRDGFVTAFDPSRDAVLYSGCLGGLLDDYGWGVAADAEGNACVTGTTFSTNFPVTLGAFQAASPQRTLGISSPGCGFLTKLRLQEPILGVGQSSNLLHFYWSVSAPGYLLQSAPDLSAAPDWSLVPQAPVLDHGHYTVTLGLTNGRAVFRLAAP